MECAHFGVCGSCRHYEGGYAVQLREKRRRIEAMFSPYYRGDITIFTSDEEHYRARAEFKIWHVGDTIDYAMNALHHKGVVLIDFCPMVNTAIAALMPKLLESIQKYRMGHKLFGADFLSSLDGDIVVSLLYHKRLDDEWREHARQMASALGISIIGRSRKQKMVIGDDFVVERLEVNGRSYRFKQIENSFTQPNARVNEKMLSWALQQLEHSQGDLLELYCGAGNFTIPFASIFSKVLATEISKSSIHAAKSNMALNDVDNIVFVRMSAEEFIQAIDGVREFRRMKAVDLDTYALSTLFVDPPRSGMDEMTCQFASRFETILYISCNPQTLLRDLKRLGNAYSVVSMALFDQFPYTEHLEMGVLLKRHSQ